MTNIKDIYTTYMKEDFLKHAYLLEINPEDLNQVFQLANKICNTNYSDQTILDGAAGDIKIVFPDGNDIKKTQILELQEEFINTSLTNERRVYIVADAHKLNKSSANTLLKFLEEPPAGIVAFLLTNNKHMIISTILSRCISISFNLSKKDVEIDEEYINLLEKLLVKKSKFYVNLNEDEKKKIYLKNEQKKFYENAIILTHRSLKRETDSNKRLEHSQRLKIFIEMIDLLDMNINPKMVLNKMIFLLYGGDNYA